MHGYACGLDKSGQKEAGTEAVDAVVRVVIHAEDTFNWDGLRIGRPPSAAALTLLTLLSFNCSSVQS